MYTEKYMGKPSQFAVRLNVNFSKLLCTCILYIAKYSLVLTLSDVEL